MSHLYCFYQQMKNSNHSQNVLSIDKLLQKDFLTCQNVTFILSGQTKCVYLFKNICLVTFVIIVKV
jgi:hypothetical protein